MPPRVTHKMNAMMNPTTTMNGRALGHMPHMTASPPILSIHIQPGEIVVPLAE
jgi:hypothetical protein